MIALYCNNELIGIYSSLESASCDAFELMLDGCFTSFEIVHIPATPENSLDQQN